MNRQVTRNVVKFIVIVSLGCIGLGCGVSIFAIWGAVTEDVLWRCLSTLGVVFLGSVLSGAVLAITHETTKHWYLTDQKEQSKGAIAQAG